MRNAVGASHPHQPGLIRPLPAGVASRGRGEPVSAHPTGQPPCPSSRPCSPECAEAYVSIYDRDTDVGMPPMPESDERRTILPPGLVASWEEVERER